MIEKIRRMLSRFCGGKQPFPAAKEEPESGAGRFSFFEVGFHGDRYLLQLVDCLMKNATQFIETGTNVGSTVVYAGRTYPDVQCLSCEPDAEAFQKAAQHAAGLANVTIRNETSQEFLRYLETDEKHLFNERCLFWLDAHGYGFEWPLREEVRFVVEKFREGYLLIDDFKVPGLDCFGYDEYEHQICSFDFIKDAIPPALEYDLYYPNYRDRTSEHHSLRGWGLIVFGPDRELNLEASLKERIRHAER